MIVASARFSVDVSSGDTAGLSSSLHDANPRTIVRQAASIQNLVILFIHYKVLVSEFRCKYRAFFESVKLLQEKKGITGSKISINVLPPLLTGISHHLVSMRRLLVSTRCLLIPVGGEKPTLLHYYILH
jgi:hypothetical protein